MKWSMPSLSRPMALSMPDGVSTVRGGVLPMRGCRVTVLGMMPPRRGKGTVPAVPRGAAHGPAGPQVRVARPERAGVTDRSAMRDAPPNNREINLAGEQARRGRGRGPRHPGQYSLPAQGEKRPASCGAWVVRVEWGRVCRLHHLFPNGPGRLDQPDAR